MSPRNRISLDGQWNFSFTRIQPREGCPQIKVPSPWQADPRFRDHTGEAWYQRDFEIPAEWFGDQRVVILGFGAVDYFAEVWVNDLRVGEHEGGYLPFELDVTEAAQPGTNTLTVRVDDPLEIFPEIPHGKQAWYGLLSGIWQSVWVESRPANHIQRLKIVTDGDQVCLEVNGRGNFTNGLVVEIFDPTGAKVAHGEFQEPSFNLQVEQPLLWSPDEPNLYTLKVFTHMDAVIETFGFRRIEVREGRILLNGRPFYLRGALDQDYYPGTIYTPPSLEYIEDEFRKAKEMGLNCLRIHIKIGDPRYYAAADRLGLLIWTELPNHIVLTEEAKRRARETLAGMLERDGNHPSIGIWTIINESWGIDLTDPSQRAWLSETYAWFTELDPTRLVVGNSACWSNFHVITDIADFHSYYAMPDHLEKWRKWTSKYAGRPWWLFAHEYTEHKLWREFLLDPWHGSERPLAPDAKPKGDEPLLVSEFGNWGLPDIQKLYAGNDGEEPWWFDTGLNWSYGVVYPHGIQRRFREYHLDRVFSSLSALTEASQQLQWEALKFEIEDMRAHASIQGYVVTELTDVHWESNGLLDMYRNPKAYYSLLKKFNADDVIIPVWEELTYWAGQICTIKILLSHYSSVDIEQPMLIWEARSDVASANGVQIPAGKCLPFDITKLGSISYETPEVQAPTLVHLDVKLWDGERLIACTDQEIYVFPKPSLRGHGQVVFSPELQAPLEELGYSVSNDLSQAKLAVVNVLDDSLREFILSGGRVLLLAEDENALQMHIPYIDVEAREDTAWQGDWASSFGWHCFSTLPTGGVVNMAFTGLTPDHVITGCSPRDFAFHVYAGLFVGWLHKPVPTIARRWVGQGEVLISTFRLSKNLKTNPLALYLFAELMEILKRPATHSQSNKSP